MACIQPLFVLKPGSAPAHNGQSFLQFFLPFIIADLLRNGQEIKRNIDLALNDQERVLILPVDAISENRFIVLHDEILKIDFRNPVAVGVFRQYFVFVLHLIMNLNPMAYRAK